MKRTNLTSRGIFLLISLLAGAFLLSQSIDFQTTLSAGDHGLVLYAAEATLRGEVPYHDYHYFYGPLMPYYYSVFLKIFGNSIISILIGEKFLILISGLLVYASLSLFISPFFSLTGALWFWVFNNNFFYTYNHVGITAASLIVVYGTLRYFHHKHIGSLYLALAGCFLAGLIKLNFGGALLAAVILSALLIDRSLKQRFNKRFYLIAILLAPATILLANAAFLVGLPMYIIRQCYQYFGNDVIVEYYPTFIKILELLVKGSYAKIAGSWYSEFVLVIIAIFGLANVYMIKKGKIASLGMRDIFVPAAVLMIFILLCLHEFLMSGVFFRAYYAIPFVIIVFFLVIGYFARHSPPFLQTTVLGLVCCVLLIQTKVNLRVFDQYRVAAHYLPFKKGGIFSANTEQWTKTVAETVTYLDKNLKQDELFLALPYEPLYYYLTDRPSPTRTLAAFKFLNIEKEQDIALIKSIEDHHINVVLVSNRAITHEMGLGVFGVDYCPLLASYLEENFTVAAQFGMWTPEPSWAWNHGIRILKRKE